MATRNTVVFIWSYIMDCIWVQNKDNTSMALLKVVSQILELYFFILSHFSHASSRFPTISPGLILHRSFVNIPIYSVRRRFSSWQPIHPAPDCLDIDKKRTAKQRESSSAWNVQDTSSGSQESYGRRREKWPGMCYESFLLCLRPPIAYPKWKLIHMERPRYTS